MPRRPALLSTRRRRHVSAARSNSNTIHRSVEERITLIKEILTILALLCAGFWFFMSRQVAPQLEIEHQVEHRSIDSQLTWIRLYITAKNTGRTMVQLDRLTPRIQIVKPLNPKVRPYLENFKPDPGNSHLVPWKIAKEFHLNRELYVQLMEDHWLEPGEVTRLEVDFVLDNKIENSPETVILYTYLTAKKGLFNWGLGRPPGWGRSTVYDIKSPATSPNTGSSALIVNATTYAPPASDPPPPVTSHW